MESRIRVIMNQSGKGDMLRMTDPETYQTNENEGDIANYNWAAVYYLNEYK